jgi:adenosine deaminase
MLIEAPQYQDIKALPKIELHRHLEGSVRLQTLVDIAREFAFEMPEYDVEMLRPFVQMMPGEQRDATHFLGKFATLRQFYRSPEVIQRIVREVIEDAAADNILYLELRFTPRALSSVINVQPPEVIGWVCDAGNQEAARLGIQVRYIVSVNRHESIEFAEQVLHSALDYRHQGVVAVDLAGQEIGYPCGPFAESFRQVREGGLAVTIHAGEWQGAESVRDAIDTLGARRIGHGIRSIEDKALIEEMIERGIVLEVCPSSNVDSGVIPGLEHHPLPKLSELGVLTTINTDDPLISNITLTDEMLRAVRHMNFSLEDLKALLMRAAEAAFLPLSDRMLLVAQLRSTLYPDAPTASQFGDNP